MRLKQSQLAFGWFGFRSLLLRRPGGLGDFWFFTECFLAVVCVVLNCFYLRNGLFNIRERIRHVVFCFVEAGSDQLAAPYFQQLQRCGVFLFFGQLTLNVYYLQPLGQLPLAPGGHVLHVGLGMV